jgi:hydroxypyruvate isomerase
METAAVMGRISACLEWLFAEDDADLADRVSAAQRAGLRRVEFWYWRDRDIEALRTRASDLAVQIGAVVTDPADIGNRASHPAWLRGVEESLEVAARLGAGVVVATAGNRLPGSPLTEQVASVTAALTAAGSLARRAGIRLALEPLNDRVDHRGALVTGTTMALRILDAVPADAVGVLWDVYHASVMGEDLRSVPGQLGDRLAYVQVADDPGRHEPGTGRIGWNTVIGALDDAGYDGPIGLEYRPTMASEASVKHTAEVLAGAVQPGP